MSEHVENFLGVGMGETASRIESIESILAQAHAGVTDAIGGSSEGDAIGSPKGVEFFDGQGISESRGFSRDPAKFAESLRGLSIPAIRFRSPQKRSLKDLVSPETGSDFSRDPKKFAQALR